MPDLNRQMASGALWMGLLRLCIQTIGLISTIILARLLLPEDFGLVAMATSIIALLQLLTAFNFDIALIQKQDADRTYFDSAWTLNLLFYATLAILLILLARPAATFYAEPRLQPVIQVLSLGFFIQGFENIGIVYFRKELNFRKDFLWMLAKKIGGFIVTIPLAFVLRSYWALIIGMVAANIIGVVLTYILHPFRPRFSFTAAGELFNFSKWLILNNLINFLRNRSPDFVIGRISGASSLGLFSIGFEISTLPTTELVGPVNRAVFPGYSKMAGDNLRLQRGYLDVLSLVALVALPAAFGLAAIAQPLVQVVFGEKWAGTVPLIEILAIYGGLNAIQTNTGSVFNAIGKPYLIALVGVVSMTLLLTTSITLALEFGPIGVAFAYLGTTIVTAPISYYLVCKAIGLSASQITTAVAPPLVYSVAMYWVLRTLHETLASTLSMNSTLTLLALIILGILVYVGLTLAAWLARGRPDDVAYRAILALSQRWRN